MTARRWQWLAAFIAGLSLTRPAAAQSPSAWALRYDGVVAQSQAWSCGAAALATLLQTYAGKRVSERDVIDALGLRFAPAPPGLTLWQLRQAAERLGFAAGAYTLDEPNLETFVRALHLPVLVHLDAPPHYALYLGRLGAWVALADPARGNVLEDVRVFRRRWDGAALAVAVGQENDGARRLARQLAPLAARLTLLQQWR